MAKPIVPSAYPQPAQSMIGSFDGELLMYKRSVKHLLYIIYALLLRCDTTITLIQDRSRNTAISARY